MTIIVEGVDAMGKSTQINKIKEYFENNGKAVHIIHYSNLTFTKDLKKIEKASKKLYLNMMKLINASNDIEDNILILDRAHIGEVVYSPIYRNYSGEYVYDLENELNDSSKKKTKLILFTDTAENVIERDINRGDGLSFTLDVNKKKEELMAFESAVNKSSINHKIVELKGRGPDAIFNEDILPYIIC